MKADKTLVSACHSEKQITLFSFMLLKRKKNSGTNIQAEQMSSSVELWGVQSEELLDSMPAEMGVAKSVRPLSTLFIPRLCMKRYISSHLNYDTVSSEGVFMDV